MHIMFLAKRGFSRLTRVGFRQRLGHGDLVEGNPLFCQPRMPSNMW